ncbi:hypothetical protein TSAR_007843 [Trichomalopsis sarcophagae]|uniref:Uncharacterized protein n=1 Tax=Trichomalopsis sarcophagae TaxID=543379 RepID=A0A232FMX6_9HYME|nr:hypothetical protein TSAR_007843 [Trichomalopsis sarcophagae]
MTARSSLVFFFRGTNGKRRARISTLARKILARARELWNCVGDYCGGGNSKTRGIKGSKIFEVTRCIQFYSGFRKTMFHLFKCLVASKIRTFIEKRISDLQPAKNKISIEFSQN